MKIDRILIASNNRDKSKEISTLLNLYNIEILSAADLSIKDPEETGSTFLENAILKAKYYGDLTQLPSLADDSGMCVTALDGAPGVYSARFAGSEKNFNQAFNKIEELLKEKGLTSSPATFNCSLALWFPNNEIIHVEGVVKGIISFPPRGEHRFGYDPIFVPEGYNQTFAEMDRSLKNQISHRAQAFNKLINLLITE